LFLAKHICLCKHHEHKHYTFTVASSMNSLYQTLQHYYDKNAVDIQCIQFFQRRFIFFMRLRYLFVYTKKKSVAFTPTDSYLL